MLHPMLGESWKGRAVGVCHDLVPVNFDRYRPGDDETWKYIAPTQKGGLGTKDLCVRHLGWRIPCRIYTKPRKVVVQEHWCSGGFADTDLIRLKKHRIHQLIVIGLIAHTCVEATVRYAAELGYDVTVVRDTTADYSDEMMHAALVFRGQL
jgi:ureidoacrylate peracid hydrolase